jgi:hypothetical protein
MTNERAAMRARIVDIAVALADTAWGRLAGPKAFRWHDALGHRPDVLAQWLLMRRAQPDRVEATAADLYAFAVVSMRGARPWDEIPAPLRVAVEVFRASFLTLVREYETSPAGSPFPPPPLPDPLPDAAPVRPVPVHPVPVRPAPVHPVKARPSPDVIAFEARWSDDGRPKKRTPRS